MKTKRTKAYNRAHVKERALTRYNLKMTDGCYDRLSNQVLSGVDCILVNKENERETYVVDFGTNGGKSELMLVVFNTITSRVETLLPKEHIVQAVGFRILGKTTLS